MHSSTLQIFGFSKSITCPLRHAASSGGDPFGASTRTLSLKPTTATGELDERETLPS